jgi:hypothetical protein
MEAELIGVNNAMPRVMWTRNFLQGQGFIVWDNVVFQDNHQSATILLEKNGRASSGCITHHINIQYFFVTGCPTNDMIGDFFTKPLQAGVKVS